MDSQKGQEIVLNAVKFLKKSSDARVSILHNGKSNSKAAKLIKFIIANLPAEQCKLILQKIVQDEKWLNKVESDFGLLKDVVNQVSLFPLCVFYI